MSHMLFCRVFPSTCLTRQVVPRRRKHGSSPQPFGEPGRAPRATQGTRVFRGLFPPPPRYHTRFHTPGLGLLWRKQRGDVGVGSGLDWAEQFVARWRMGMWQRQGQNRAKGE